MLEQGRPGSRYRSPEVDMSALVEDNPDRILFGPDTTCDHGFSCGYDNETIILILLRYLPGD